MGKYAPDKVGQITYKQYHIVVSIYQIHGGVSTIPSNQLKRKGSARPSTDCLREFSMTWLEGKDKDNECM